MRLVGIGLFLLVAATGSAAGAQDSSSPSAADTVRRDGALSFMVGLLTPTPSLVSANLAYAPAEHLRLAAGIGLPFGDATLGASATYLVSPRRPVSLAAGIGVSRTVVHYGPDDLFAFGSTGSTLPDKVVWEGAVIGGVDWQTRGGFHLGAGLSWVFSSQFTFYTPVLPYLTIGHRW